jgi:hypothetical protein
MADAVVLVPDLDLGGLKLFFDFIVGPTIYILFRSEEQKK